MRVIGILGGVASGKSLVAQHLAALGAVVLDADRAGHEALRQPAIRAAARARWGDNIFDSQGQIERPRLAQIVFAPTERGAAERKYLEQLTHPEIGRRLTDEIEQARAAGAPAVVLDAAVMIEAGWDTKCDVLLYVDASRPVRLARAQSRGWTAQQFAEREQAQLCLDNKRQRAAAVIDNSGTPEETRSQVERLWREHVCVGERS